MRNKRFGRIIPIPEQERYREREAPREGKTKKGRGESEHDNEYFKAVLTAETKLFFLKNKIKWLNKWTRFILTNCNSIFLNASHVWRTLQSARFLGQGPEIKNLQIVGLRGPQEFPLSGTIWQ